MPQKLARQIGYKKQESDKKQPDNPKVKTKKSAEPVLVVEKKDVCAEDVIAWIKAHPLIKHSSMCKLIGTDPGNFTRTICSEKPIIKQDVLAKIVEVIKDYGFRP